MQDQWSTYYQGQAPPQPSTSTNYDYNQSQQQQQQLHAPPSHKLPKQQDQIAFQQQQPQLMTTIPEQRIQYGQSTYLLPQLYTGDAAMSMSMRSGTSSSISSSISSASGHVSPTSMRTSMSSSTTGQTPSTPASSFSLASPFFTKDGTLQTSNQESWFGSLQDSYLSTQAPTYDPTQSTRPTLYRMDRMSISSPIPSATEQPATWGQTSMSPQQRTPRRASVAVFQSSPSSSHTASYQAGQQQMNFSPQAAYQSPPQQQQHMSSMPHIQQSWNSVMVAPSFQPNYSYQQAPVNSAPSTSNPPPTYSLPTNNGMGIDLNQSYYPSQTSSWQPTASTQQSAQVPQVQGAAPNYNFAGVLLEAGDLHMLGPDPLSPTAPPAALPTYKPAKAGWQPTFTFGNDTTPKAVQTATMQPLPRQFGSISEVQPNWNFASFHGFTPLPAVAASAPLTERASSAPPPVEIAAVPMPNALAGEDMSRRRGSSVDSPSMLPFQLATFPSTLSPPRAYRASYQTSPVYLGKGPAAAKSAPSTIAARRATVGPSPLDLAKSGRTQSTPVTQSTSLPLSSPPKSAPIPATVPSSPATPRRGRGSRRSAAPMFINFTGKDAKKLLSGVAPSGSSKRKREEEEARNQVKHVKFEMGSKESSVDSSANPT
ncbi:hypothetical protein P389DRAFT_7093 [Cystobasidium minutum MCA 4210]|uniref:uncharacterized protein n=1 Tax=Cystobasidium minutum MCA 4210 TaxID=1397322 RepID=UPI0034CF0D55|eukprot:jgi/Rhomi1/7093/CE7092_1516